MSLKESQLQTILYDDYILQVLVANLFAIHRLF